MFDYGTFDFATFDQSPQAVEVEQGALFPSLFTNANSFFASTVTVSAIDLAPSLYTNTNNFFAATVAPGAVTLTPAFFAKRPSVARVELH